ncbi:MAG: monofunctional biosynthetic peptidoglycan transglycosylase [Rhodobacteraceae bacterium]|nr:monofunctional biosynthetic peptidoglycan transglycosylase [Paracoccaceae bacterium]
MTSARVRRVARSRQTSSALPLRRLRPLRWVWRGLLGLCLLVALLVGAYAIIPLPGTPYMLAERVRLGQVRYEWADMDAIAPVMARSAVAAEDANFCRHWGFDIDALRDAIDGGARRGGSTITQQVVKNAFLWQGRSWPRKAMEAVLTPAVEMVWSKRRILEVYLNIAEFDEGVFGVGAAAPWYFGVSAKNLSATQAARLAAILPDPKDRSAAKPSGFVRKRAASIADGAATIRRDGRAACFGG